MKRRLALLFFVFAFAFALVILPRTARAQGTSVQSVADASEVEVGEVVTLTLVSQSEGETASDPQPGPHPGFSIVDQAVSPTQMVSIINGRRTDKQGLTVTWTMRADRVGTFVLGPPSVAAGGGRKNGSTHRVTVVAQGKGTQPRGGGRSGGRRPPQTIDPFKGIFPGFDDDDEFFGRGREPPTDPKYGMNEARAPVAFLHATIDKTHAVVGEQVTLSVYLYEDPHARQGHPSDVHEATATDFIKRSLLQDETRAIGLGNAMVGGRAWSVKLVRKSALFPLKTGRLAIQPMSLTLPQARIGLRESEVLYVQVTEPPAAGRPAGYQLGDVGDFSLSATVTPRALAQGGAVGVSVELRGTGNMPSTLPVPVAPGVEWLEPQVTDSLGPMQNDRFGGSRTFAYVVRIAKSGAVDLGNLQIPYWDAERGTYALARAGLGVVDVTPGAVRDAGPEAIEEILPGLPKERRVLEGVHHDSFLTDRSELWLALFGAPLACAAFIGANGVVRRARSRKAGAAPSHDKIAREKRAEAEAALRGDDGKAATSAIAGALEASVLAATKVNVRGTAGEGAERELVAAGVPDDAALEVVAVLRACEDARFSPDGVTIDDAKKLWKRAQDVTALVTKVRA
jgi:hypothetical protein